jgi:hypothetical protein
MEITNFRKYLNNHGFSSKLNYPLSIKTSLFARNKHTNVERYTNYIFLVNNGMAPIEAYEGLKAYGWDAAAKRQMDWLVKQTANETWFAKQKSWMMNYNTHDYKPALNKSSSPFKVKVIKEKHWMDETPPIKVVSWNGPDEWVERNWHNPKFVDQILKMT